MSRAKTPLRPVVHRAVSEQLGVRVLQRDNFTCQACGAVAGDADPFQPGRPLRLTIGYMAAKTKDRQDALGNLRAECTACNEGLRNVPLPKSSRMELLKQVRRATIDDQRAVLEVLQRRLRSAG